MAISEKERDSSLRLLVAAYSARYAEQRVEADSTPGRLIYHSPMRPFWIGFDREIAADAGFTGYSGEMRLVETERPATIGFLNRFELLPASSRAMEEYSKQIAGVESQFSLQHNARRELAVAWVNPNGYSVTAFDVSSPGEPVILSETNHLTMASAILNMADNGFSRYTRSSYTRRYLDVDFEARRLSAEVASLELGIHPGQGEEHATYANLVMGIRDDDPEYAASLADYLEQHPTDVGGPSSAVIKPLFSILRGDKPDVVAVTSDESKRKWIDLSEHGVYLADQRMADGKARLIVIDMKNLGDKARLAEIGFFPVQGSPRYDSGIFYLQGDDQRLRPKALAKAFGIEGCPIVDVDPREILRVFQERMLEKFGLNLNALALRARPLGQNAEGQFVFESPAGRFIRLSTDNAVSESSEKGREKGRPSFLRAQDDNDLRECAEGFLWKVRQGAKTNWADLTAFGRTVFSSGAVGKIEPTDQQMHRLQEAIESAAYRHFSNMAIKPDLDSFKLASDIYFGLPSARMRTSESVFLQQYSTPLPMSVVAQKVLLGKDEPPASGVRTLLEPTAGNGGLMGLLPGSLQLHALELDPKRLDALQGIAGLNAQLGDATDVAFRSRFGVVDGFDYTIANPPFGQMDAARSFDKLSAVRRLDHFIGLRTLEARKDHGRSVLIFAADSAQSDGQIRGSARSFLNYIHDHYQVEGLAEVDGRLYSRNGAGYNVRMMVVGNKRPVPIEVLVPEKLTVITSYDDLWFWSDQVVERSARLSAAVEAEFGEPVITTKEVGKAEPLFDADQAAIVPVVERPASTRTGTAKKSDLTEMAAPNSATSGLPAPHEEKLPVTTEVLLPWQLVKKNWEQELASSRAGTGIGGFTRGGGNELAAKMARAEFLRYGVSDWARDKLAAAQSGSIKLSPEDLAAITDRLETSVSHRDVVDKALGEGKRVPQEVLADYPDLNAPVERHVNEFQAPYQPASKSGEPSSMVPINMAGATYAALNDLEALFGSVDGYVASKLRYDVEELPRFFSPEQVDAIGLAIKSVEEGRGIINADQTGLGKGRFVAAMLRYAKLNEKMPVFLTIKPELFTDIFRDINDIGSQDLFKKLFIFNDGENVKKYGTEKEVLYRATTPAERKAAISSGEVEPDTDMVLATYSQFMREYHKNPKANLLTQIASNNAMLILDEAHVASGASNLSATVGQAVANSDSVLYASATPLKGVSNFSIYSKVFPASVDLLTLAETLQAGGEALQEAISTNMARDGVLIRREHDFSKLTFHTRNPTPETLALNISLANDLSEIVAGLSYLAGDVSRVVADLNKGYKKDWEEIPDSDRQGSRMQASSMNFGSRLYSLNRQFLLGIKIEDAVESSLTALNEGRKPVIAVENTGEALLRQVIARRAGIEHLEVELLELDEKAGALSLDEKLRRETLVSTINSSLREVLLDEPPQYRELLDSMLDRIGVIKVQGRYGDVRREKPSSDEYKEAEERLREKIKIFPDLPLTPIDVIKKQLEKRGYPVAEVSGRTASIIPNEADASKWDVKFHSKADAVANVAGFQNGKYDAIVITRSGSTGISLHATDRFDDSDIRQRDFIVLQKAGNIAEFLQWMGRVNRKDQVVPPVITGLESGLPAELRLTMMHNAKLRKLSANTTSNRDNANLEGEELDLLNDVGDRVALEWLVENPDIAGFLDIKLPSDDDLENLTRFSQDSPYVNKLMGRLMMVEVSKQEEILKALTQRFADKIDELEQRGENPFKVAVYDWSAEIVREEELQSGVIRSTGSTFDAPVKMVTMRYEQDVYPIRSDKLLAMVKVGSDVFKGSGVLGEDGTVQQYRKHLMNHYEDWIHQQLPAKLRNSGVPLSTLLEGKDVAGAKNAKEKADWLLAQIEAFRPGVRLTHDDLFKGERIGVITSVEFPRDIEDLFLLSKYRAKVAFPGDEKTKEMTLATVRNQSQDLAAGAWFAIDSSAAGKVIMPHIKRQVDQVLAAFDDEADGKVVRTQYVLQGNIFRACELASSQKLGSPILYTDSAGDRHRAVLLKDRVTPEMVKSLPIGLDARDMAEYIDEYLAPQHPQHSARVRSGGFEFYDSGVKDMKQGEGVMLQVDNGGQMFTLTVPGTKSKSGSLMADASIFDIGEKTPASSLGLKLAGSRSCMKVSVDRDVLPLLLERLQRGHHVGKFYLPVPDHETLGVLKARYEAGFHKHRQQGESDLSM